MKIRKKIGIITFFQTTNLGTLIQAYCTYKLVKNLHQDSTVDLLDYEIYQRSLFRFRELYPSTGIRSGKFKLFNISSLKKQLSSRRFLKTNCNLRYIGFFHGTFKPINILEKLKYDTVYVGSDTVWMHNKKRAPYIPNIYFLPLEMGNFNRRAICVSMDPTRNNNNHFVPSNEKLFRALNGFERIVVRDKNTQSMVKQVAPKAITHLSFDPALIYPYQDEFKIDYVYYDKLNREKILIWSQNLQNKMIASVLSKTEFKGTEPFDINWKLNPIKQEIEEMTKFGGLVTDRFHRAILMMKSSDAPVIFLESETKYPSLGSKGRELMSSLDLNDYVIRSEDLKNDKGFTLVELIRNWDNKLARKRQNRLSEIELIEKQKIFKYFKV
jgi:hypothetical protein